MRHATGSMHPGATPTDRKGLKALEASLRRRFRVVESTAHVGEDTYTLLHPASAEDLISEAEFEEDERLPYWADVWPSAHVLAGRVRAMDAAGRTCLELGCGAGLVTCAASRAGFAVTASDYYLDALNFTAVNAWRATRRTVSTRAVDWRTLPDDLPRFDVVLAADVLYEQPYGALVAQAIARTLAPGGTAFVADPGRMAAPEFDRAAAELGLTVERVARIGFDTGVARQHIDIRAVMVAREG